MSEYIAHGEELWFVVLYDAAVGRNVDFAIAEGIECIHRLIRRSTRSKMYEDFYIRRCDVFYLTSLDFSLFYCLGNAFDEAYRGFAVWYFADDERLVVEFVNLGSYLQNTTSLPIVVFAYVDGTTSREIGVDTERFSLEIVDGCIAKVVEVMRQYLAAQSHGDTLGTLCQKQWKFGWQGDRFFVSSVVGELPIGSFRVEYYIQGEFRESCLDVSGSGCTVAREDIAPVTLCVDEQVFLSHLYEGISDRCISVRVELHRMSHDVSHLVVSSVIHALHGVEDASLYGFQSVFDMRYGSLQDHIRCIVEEPVLIHSAEVMYGRSIKTVHRFVIGVFLRRIFLIYLVFIFNFVAHM